MGVNLAEIFNTIDESGNKLELVGSDLFLTLSVDRRRRNIGQIKPHHIDGKLTYTKHEDEKDIFRSTNAWSLYYHIVKNVVYIMIYTDYKMYKITAENAMKYGSFLYFKTSGYEKKIYVPLTYWWIGTV